MSKILEAEEVKIKKQQEKLLVKGKLPNNCWGCSKATWISRIFRELKCFGYSKYGLYRLAPDSMFYEGCCSRYKRKASNEKN